MTRLLFPAIAVVLVVGFQRQPPASAATFPATLTVVDQNFTVPVGARLEIKLAADGTAINPVAAALTPTTTTTTTPPSTTPATIPSNGSTNGSIGSGAVSGPTGTVPPASTVPASTVPAGPDPLEDLSIRIEVFEPVTNSKGVQATLDGDAADLGDVVDKVEHPLRDVVTLPPEGPTNGVLDVAIDETIYDPTDREAPKNTLNKLEPGVYPMSIQLLNDKTVIAQTTTLFERVAADALERGPVSVAVMMRIPSGATPAAQDAPAAQDDATTDERITAELTQLADLAESTDFPLSVFLEPEAVIPVLTADPELAARLNAVLTPGDVVLGAPLIPLDPSAATAVELDDLYGSWLTEGLLALRQMLPATVVSSQVTMVSPDLTTAGATLLADTGSQLFVTTADTYARLRGSIGSELDPSLLSKIRLADNATAPLAVIEPNISALLSLAGTSPIEPSAELRLTVAVTADLAVVRYGSKPDVRSLVLATPNLAPPSPQLLARLVSYAQSAVNITPQSVTSLPGATNTQFLDGKPVTARLGSTPTIDLEPRMTEERRARLIVADAASMLPADTPDVQRWTNELDEVFRTDWSDRQAQTVIDRVAAEADDVRTSVLAPEPFPLTITGRTADLPIQIESRSSVPLTVTVHLESDQLTFPEGDQSVVLTPNGTTSLVVPVKARTNGVVRLTVQLMTPAGNDLTDDVTITARFTAISGMGKLITGALVLILLTWWVSYYRRHRASRRAEQLAASQRHPTRALAKAPRNSAAAKAAKTDSTDDPDEQTTSSSPNSA